jgi:hypothetical protein
LWLAPLFGTLCGTSAMAILEKASIKAVVTVAVANAPGPFILVMSLLVALGAWTHSLHAAWSVRVTLGLRTKEESRYEALEQPFRRISGRFWPRHQVCGILAGRVEEIVEVGGEHVDRRRTVCGE